jgi:hypothetical protein
MQLNLSQQIAAIIQQGYEGGIQKFRADGGMIDCLPTEKADIIIYHPSLPEDLRKAFIELGEKIQTPVIISNRLNFVGLEPEEIQAGMERLVQEDLLGKSVRCAFMVDVVSFNLYVDGDLSQQDIDGIVEAIKVKVPGVVRGVVATTKTSTMFEVEPKKVILLNDRPQRDRPIGDDDLTNLKISLHGDVDVMDLIKNL